jgi:hypothetical protein
MNVGVTGGKTNKTADLVGDRTPHFGTMPDRDYDQGVTAEADIAPKRTPLRIASIRPEEHAAGKASLTHSAFGLPLCNRRLELTMRRL